MMLKGYFQNSASHQQDLLVCAFLINDHQNPCWPHEVVKKLTFFNKMFSFGPKFEDPLAKMFYINLIHKHVHKRNHSKEHCFLVYE